MSIDRCIECDRTVDTSWDDNAYGDDDNGPCTCHACRERAWLAQLRDQALDDPRHGQAKELNACASPRY